MWPSPNGGECLCPSCLLSLGSVRGWWNCTTHVVWVKGQRVRASLGVRPEGQTSISHLVRSTNIDILFSTGQTQPTFYCTLQKGTWGKPCQANVVIRWVETTQLVCLIKEQRGRGPLMWPNGQCAWREPLLPAGDSFHSKEAKRHQQRSPFHN